MASLRSAAWSSVGKKLITGVTGLLLVGWITAHLIGNLTIYIGADAFNSYAHFLENLGHGYAIYVMELGMVAFFVFHIVAGVSIWVGKRKSRPQRYAKKTNAGGASRKSPSSSSMLISGTFLLVYVVLHVKHFKYGDAAIIDVHGEQTRDLYSLIVQEFNDPIITVAYVGAMLFLGLHLRHGVWSMLQSLGLLDSRLLPLAYSAASVVALLLALGFLLLPVYVYFFVDPVAVSAMSLSKPFFTLVGGLA